MNGIKMGLEGYVFLLSVKFLPLQVVGIFVGILKIHFEKYI